VYLPPPKGAGRDRKGAGLWLAIGIVLIAAAIFALNGFFLGGEV
jgi:hypothetical protein